MYVTLNYTQIKCRECDNIVDVLKPGQPFNDIKKCEKCNIPKPAPKKRTVKPKIVAPTEE